jgi:plastocyanin
VTWEFHQPDAPHNVVSLSGPSAFNSGVPQGHGTFQYTFNATGTYTYDCQVHPNMTGTIIVTP